MKTFNLFLLAAGLFVAHSGMAQKIMLTQGDLSFLKGQKNLKVQYDYTGLEVGDYNNEADYKKKKIKEMNDKESGKGDAWAESWERDKTVRYPEKFEELLNKIAAESGFKFSQNESGSTYTLIVKTRFIEPGFNVGVMKKPAAVSFEYTFVETANPSNVKAVMTQKLVPGSQAMGFDYDTGTRIAEAYAKAGKMLAAFIGKQLK